VYAAARPAQLARNAAVSHGKLHDILDVLNTTVLGRGFFLNGANTLRQSVEASITPKSNPCFQTYHSLAPRPASNTLPPMP
jgi:hypothetical protein